MSNVVSNVENTPAVKFIERNYHVLLFLLIILAVVFLFLYRKTDQAIILMAGYIVGQVANAKNVIGQISRDRDVFVRDSYNNPSNPNQPSSGVGGSPAV